MRRALVALLAGSGCGLPLEWSRLVDRGDMLHSSNDLAVDPENMPAVGNGYLATQIGAGTLFVSGVYNGKATVGGTSSHRAAIPCDACALVAPGVSADAALDLPYATYRRRSFIEPKSGDGAADTCSVDLAASRAQFVLPRLGRPGDNELTTAPAGCTALGERVWLEQRWFAHRTLRNVLVAEIAILGLLKGAPAAFAAGEDSEPRDWRASVGPPVYTLPDTPSAAWLRPLFRWLRVQKRRSSASPSALAAPQLPPPGGACCSSWREIDELLLTDSQSPLQPLLSDLGRIAEPSPPLPPLLPSHVAALLSAVTRDGGAPVDDASAAAIVTLAPAARPAANVLQAWRRPRVLRAAGESAETPENTLRDIGGWGNSAAWDAALDNWRAIGGEGTGSGAEEESVPFQDVTDLIAAPFSVGSSQGADANALSLLRCSALQPLLRSTQLLALARARLLSAHARERVRHLGWALPQDAAAAAASGGWSEGQVEDEDDDGSAQAATRRLPGLRDLITVRLGTTRQAEVGSDDADASGDGEQGPNAVGPVTVVVITTAIPALQPSHRFGSATNGTAAGVVALPHAGDVLALLTVVRTSLEAPPAHALRDWWASQSAATTTVASVFSYRDALRAWLAEAACADYGAAVARMRDGSLHSSHVEAWAGPTPTPAPSPSPRIHPPGPQRRTPGPHKLFPGQQQRSLQQRELMRRPGGAAALLALEADEAENASASLPPSPPPRPPPLPPSQAHLWASGIELTPAAGLPPAATASLRALVLALNASQHSLHSFLRRDWPFGASPGGLATDGYGGRQFWDYDTFSFPGLLLLAPEAALASLQYRLHRLPGARLKARSYAHPPTTEGGGDGFDGYAGAAVPWESALTGAEACPVWAATGVAEVHVSGDVAVSLRQAWQAMPLASSAPGNISSSDKSGSISAGESKDATWLRDVAFPLLAEIADMWTSRAIANTQALLRGHRPGDDPVPSERVVVPGWNDGAEKDREVDTKSFRPLAAAAAATRRVVCAHGDGMALDDDVAFTATGGRHAYGCRAARAAQRLALSAGPLLLPASCSALLRLPAHIAMGRAAVAAQACTGDILRVTAPLPAVTQLTSDREINEATAAAVPPLHITGVIPPTESYPGVTDSAYTNGVAKLSLLHAATAARALGLPSDVWQPWQATGDALVIPLDAEYDPAADARVVAAAEESGAPAPDAGRLSLGLHPYFDGFRVGSDTVQCLDVPMLWWPLGVSDTAPPALQAAFRQSRGVFRNDLAHYAAHQDGAGSVAFAWALNSVLAAEAAATAADDAVLVARSAGGGGTAASHAAAVASVAALRADAAAFLGRSHRDFVHGPFRVWREYAGGGGVPNFATGGGALIEAVLFGYARVRMHAEPAAGVYAARGSSLWPRMLEPAAGVYALTLRPSLPPDTEAVTLRALAYAGHRITVRYTATEATLTLLTHPPAAAACTAPDREPLSTAEAAAGGGGGLWSVDWRFLSQATEPRTAPPIMPPDADDAAAEAARWDWLVAAAPAYDVSVGDPRSTASTVASVFASRPWRLLGAAREVADPRQPMPPPATVCLEAAVVPAVDWPALLHGGNSSLGSLSVVNWRPLLQQAPLLFSLINGAGDPSLHTWVPSAIIVVRQRRPL